MLKVVLIMSGSDQEDVFGSDLPLDDECRNELENYLPLDDDHGNELEDDLPLSDFGDMWELVELLKREEAEDRWLINDEVGFENSEGRKDTEKIKDQDASLDYEKNNTFYQDDKINNAKLKLYENVWRALQNFINSTALESSNMNLKSTRFMVSYV